MAQGEKDCDGSGEGEERMIQYKISIYSTNIDEVDVIKETDKTYWVKGMVWGKPGIVQNRKDTIWSNLFKTKQEAVNAIQKRLQEKLEYAERDLERAKTALFDFIKKK